MRKTLMILSAGLGLLLLATGCNLEYGSGDSNSEVDAQLQQAQQQAEAAQQAQQAQQAAASSAASGSSTASASSGSLPGASNQFLWKPVSEGDGNLVVLLPSKFRGQVSGARIVRGGTVLENGRFTTDDANGFRPHYRFSRPGSAYGTGLTLQASTTSGTQSWSIPNGSQRTTY